MTHSNKVTLPLGALASIAIGIEVVRAPLATTTIVIGSLCVILLFAQGVQTLVIGTLFLFPLVPSQLHAPGLTGLYPQRVLLAVVALALLLDRDVAAQHRWRLRAVAVSLRLFLAFLAAGCLSAVVSPAPATALSGVVYYAFHLGLPFVVGMLVAERSMVSRYACALSLAALVVGAVAVLQYVAPSGPWASSFLDPYATTQISSTGVRALSVRSSGTLGHPVALGTFAVMVLPFLIRIGTMPRGRTVWLARSALVALVIAIMLSQTRMALLAVPAALLPWIVLGTRRRVVAGAAVSAAIGLIVLFGTGALGRETAILTQALSYRGEAGSSDPALNSIAARSSIYITGFRVFEAHPIVGVGFRLPTQHYDLPVFQNVGQVYAFESYLVVALVEGGVVGLGLMAAFVGALVWAATRRLADRDDRATIYSALLTGLVLAVGSNGFDVVVSYYWLLIGLVFGLGLARPQGPDRQGAPALRSRHRTDATSRTEPGGIPQVAMCVRFICLSTPVWPAVPRPQPHCRQRIRGFGRRLSPRWRRFAQPVLRL